MIIKSRTIGHFFGMDGGDYSTTEINMYDENGHQIAQIDEIYKEE